MEAAQFLSGAADRGLELLTGVMHAEGEALANMLSGHDGDLFTLELAQARFDLYLSYFCLFGRGSSRRR